MRWSKPNLKSLHSLWGQMAHGEPASRAATEAVRRAMLEATPVVVPGGPYADVFRKIRYAADIQALWYARSDLMGAVASARGEAIAWQEIAAISKLFDGLLAESRSSQPTRHAP